MKKNYIGFASTFHDSAMAIVNSEGKVVFAEATERYLQNKRAMNCPPDVFMHIGSVIDRYCEKDAELVAAQSWSEKTDDYMNDLDKTLEAAEKGFTQILGEIPYAYRLNMDFNRFCTETLPRQNAVTGKTLRYELSRKEAWRKAAASMEERRYTHHLTHAATACMTSPFSECACAVLDGYGEGQAVAAYTYRDGMLTPLTAVSENWEKNGSLGGLYMVVCDLCGFGYFKGEEWKVMGLAAYGKFDQKYYDLFSRLYTVDGLEVKVNNQFRFIKTLETLYTYQRKPGQPALEMADLAYTGQVVFSELVYRYLNNLCEITGMKNVALGGGSFLNSWTNGAVTQNTGFENAYIFSAPGDDGNAIGAALLAYKQDHPDFVPDKTFQSPYLGNELNKKGLENFLKFGGMENRIAYHPDDVCAVTAKLIARGKIVGWVQGRAEFGPRALGNRSILADARAADCKERINARVKFREEFRPFAPSILHEHGAEYFEDYMDTPYMERTLRFREEVMPLVPGVVHENKTGRLQSVHREYNAKYYDLINEFYKLTGVPLVLNTSFNVMGKPIIDTFEDAIAVFFTSGLDALVIDDMILYK